ncbi:unnamed protein product [Aphanomyces euteiches]|uniref:Uncharacterized protein n=1 Tax=Aphanomyces euteiches TaxID=100861 RepID=A0A6G0XQG8_9STRA|nr:hypothetical protein Ae201684_002462 [Aphanomyces euteiches]KAH9087381.1 hypothetical protein Ae201684P_000792 [Aphanomyces euteiches]KAH9136717.1 hypothetical protein AeRB84_018267 [Aphanomyces euteiches]
MDEQIKAESPASRANSMELVNLRFRSHPDTFRLVIDTCEGSTLPMTITLESTRTKGKWECLVSDLKYHASKDSHSQVVASSVVSALQNALLALQDEKSTWNESKVDLKHCHSGSMHLMLVMMNPSGAAIGFTFDMVPFAMSTGDVLEIKMRDLMKDIDRAQKMPEPVLMLLSEGTTKLLGDKSYSCWTIHPSVEPHYFALSEDATEVVFLKKGGYHVQIRGLSSCHESSTALGAGSSLIPSTFELYLDHFQFPVATSQGYGNFCQLSYVFSVEKTTVLSVVIHGYHRDATNVVFLVEQVPYS